MLVIGNVVNDEGLDRPEEQPGVVADTPRLRLALAHAAAQLGEDEFGAGHVVAAQHAALELRDQQSTRTGLQSPEKFPQSLNRRLTHRGHAGTTPQYDDAVDDTPAALRLR